MTKLNKISLLTENLVIFLIFQSDVLILNLTFILIKNFEKNESWTVNASFFIVVWSKQHIFKRMFSILLSNLWQE